MPYQSFGKTSLFVILFPDEMNNSCVCEWRCTVKEPITDELDGRIWNNSDGINEDTNTTNVDEKEPISRKGFKGYHKQVISIRWVWNQRPEKNTIPKSIYWKSLPKLNEWAKLMTSNPVIISRIFNKLVYTFILIIIGDIPRWRHKIHKDGT